ncbi:protein EMSY-LIKE 1-like [Amaranthus tricolor]|uniref:protein EMSY-LIKE 1-like n=1 Tax=Amaranthus tricolor TaxID=29722 RepID=UPI00258C0EE4|nr:protein EMSY-LIKE 1-like [Amaranthus tricolor]
MEQQIHNLEMDAYCAVLRAFKAQSEVLTWDKEGLMTELRKELRVSDDEHREVLSKVNNDDIIGRIREWRKGGGHQAMSTSHPINDVPSPTHASRKKQRTSQSLSTRAAPQSGGTLGPRGRKFRQFPYNNHDAHGTIKPGSGEELVGKKVLTRWPDDNHFYEAVISRYNASDGRHELVYGIHTPQESFEWVNLMEIPPEDIRWVNEDSISSRRVGPGEKRSINHVSSTPTVGRKQYRSEIQNGARNSTDDIEILHTATLIKEVEKVVAAVNPDCLELERAKKMLEEHELALVDAISRLTYISDGDSDGDQQY